jgi:hypothetical protein
MTPQEYADKLANRLSNSVTEIRQGIERVTESPCKKAASKADKYLAGVQNSVKKWQSRLNAVDLETWKKAALEKGLTRIGPGIQAAKGKCAAFAEKFFPVLNAITAEVDKMPDLTIEDSINRAAYFIRKTSEFKYQ